MNLLFGNVFKLAFVVDINQVNLLIPGHQVGDHPGSAGFSFTFGDNGQADFMNAMTQMNSCIGFLLKNPDQALEVGF